MPQQTAQFDTICGVCGGTIRKGRDKIKRCPEDKRKFPNSWQHLKCVGKTPLPPNTTTDDEDEWEEIEVEDSMSTEEAQEFMRAEINDAVTKIRKNWKPTASMIDLAEQAAVRAADEVMKKWTPPTIVIEKKSTTGKKKVAKKTKGVQHKVFPDVFEMVDEREDVFLFGPTQCGKTYMAEQVAKEAGLRFAAISCTMGMSESQIQGWRLPVGAKGQFEYVPTEWVDMYENGGVFLFDEGDGSDPNVLLVVNSALANGYMPVPQRTGKPRAERHPDFVCIMTANTSGTGGDRQYVGRNAIDAATMERFCIAKIEMDYDKKLEAALCPDTTLLTMLHTYRDKAKNAKIRRPCATTRFIQKAYKMKKGRKWDMKKIEERLFAGWTDDEKAKLNVIP